ncbi:MAG: hypothetical protein D6E12_12125 [Desulfovibrio sp.]|nr:MAG: hypothetical protein D6E12_12125 [Desulfovibrio sp.]
MHLALWSDSLTLICGHIYKPGWVAVALFMFFAGLGAARSKSDSSSFRVLVLGLLALLALGLGLGLHTKSQELILLLAPWVEAQGQITVMILACAATALPGLLTGMALSSAVFSGKASAAQSLFSVIVGAACGLAALGMFLVPRLGVSGSIVAASALLVLAGACAALSRSPAAPNQSSEKPQPDLPRHVAAPTWGVLGGGLAGSALFCGAILIVTRLAAFFLANRVAHGYCLVAALFLGLALGGFAVHFLYRHGTSRPRLLLGGLLVLGALGLVGGLQATRWWIDHQTVPNGPILGIAPQGLGESLFWSWLILLPLSLPMGALFTVLSRSRAFLAKQGQAVRLIPLFLGTGAAAGVIWVGFFGLKDIGSMASASVLALLCLALAVALLLDDFQASDKGVRTGLLILAGVTLYLIIPQAHPQTIMAGHEPLFRMEDRHGSFFAAMTPPPLERIMAVKDRELLMPPLTRQEYTRSQQMAGHLGVLYRTEATRALVVGSGNLVAAGVLARYPRIVEVQVRETWPAMLEGLEVLGPPAHFTGSEDTISLEVDLPLRALATSTQAYDIVVLAVPDPQTPEAASLFCLESMALARQTLSDQGVLIVRANGPALRQILAAVRQTFTHVVLYQDLSGYLVAASEHELAIEPLQVKWAASAPELAVLLERAALTPDALPNFLAQSALTPEDLPESITESVLPATLDRPNVAFSNNVYPQ